MCVLTFALLSAQVLNVCFYYLHAPHILQFAKQTETHERERAFIIFFSSMKDENTVPRLFVCKHVNQMKWFLSANKRIDISGHSNMKRLEFFQTGS